MSKKMVLLCILVLIGCVYLVYLTNLFVQSGWMRDLPSYVGFIEKTSLAQVQGFISYVTGFVTNPMGAAATITATGATVGAVGNAYSKLKSTRQQASQAITNIGEQAQTEINKIQSKYDVLKTDYGKLQAKVKDQTEMQLDYDALNTRFLQTEQQCKNLQSTVATYEKSGNIQYVKACEQTLIDHKIPLPQVEGETIIRTLVK